MRSGLKIEETRLEPLLALRAAAGVAIVIGPARAVTEVCRRAGGTLSPAEWRTYQPGIPYRKVC
ncbi:hypothetical protein [Streptomyces wedmorensis]